MIEMQDMGLDIVGTLYQVPDNPAILGYSIDDAEGTIQI